MRHLRFVVGLASLATVMLLGALAVLAALLPALLGLDRVVLVSGSMSPSMVVGDVVLIDPDIDDPLGPGTVITFTDPGRPGELVTHRIVQTFPDGSYRTRGDANGVPDSTPVTPETVQGRGKLMVPIIGYPSAMLAQGAPGRALLVLGGVAVLVGLSRYGLLARHDPWAAPSTSSRSGGPRRVAVLTGAGVVVLAAAVVVPQVAKASYTATTNNAASFLARSAGAQWYLKSSGTGNQTSSAVLPLATTAPTQTTLPNYDTDRNSNPGLTIAKGIGVDDTDATKVQKWSMPVTSALTLSGTAQLTTWTAMKDFDTTKTGVVQARLYDCNNPQSNCTAFGNLATLNQTPWSTVANGWTSKTFDFGTVSRTIAAGRRLQVRVAVTGASGDAVMFAFDTTAYPSSLQVG